MALALITSWPNGFNTEAVFKKFYIKSRVVLDTLGVINNYINCIRKTHRRTVCQQAIPGNASCEAVRRKFVDKRYVHTIIVQGTITIKIKDDFNLALPGYFYLQAVIVSSTTDERFSGGNFSTDSVGKNFNVGEGKKDSMLACVTGTVSICNGFSVFGQIPSSSRPCFVEGDVK